MKNKQNTFVGPCKNTFDTRDPSSVHHAPPSSESGKSMTEMIGVLAIMGLLTILGAKGYDMAMERAVATTIINDVGKRAVLHSQQLLAGSALQNDEMPPLIHNLYPVNSERLGTQFFTINVQDIDRHVCEHIAKSSFQTPIQITANQKVVSSNNVSACNNKNDLVDMGFTFTRTLRPCPDCLSSTKTCETDNQCASNQTCQNGLCLCSPYYDCNGVCCPQGQFCVNGACSLNDGCQSTNDCDQGLCVGGKCICRSYRDNCDYFCMMKDENSGTCSTGAFYEEGAFTMAGTIWSTKGWNWYAATDFCNWHGMQMVSLSDLGCVSSGDTYTCTVPEKFKGHGLVWVKEWKTSLNPYAVNTTSSTISEGGWSVGHIMTLCH